MLSLYLEITLIPVKQPLIWALFSFLLKIVPFGNQGARLSVGVLPPLRNQTLAHCATMAHHFRILY